MQLGREVAFLPLAALAPVRPDRKAGNFDRRGVAEFLDVAPQPTFLDQLDEEWKAWAKAVIQNAKVGVGGIRESDRLLAASNEHPAISDWTFACIPGATSVRMAMFKRRIWHCVKSTNDLGEQDLLTISNRWRKMATEFTEATKRTGHYHGYIKHDDEIAELRSCLKPLLCSSEA